MVTSNDLLSVLKEWEWDKNTSGVNVMRDGVNFVYLDVFGLVRIGGHHVKKGTTNYEHVVTLLLSSRPWS